MSHPLTHYINWWHLNKLVCIGFFRVYVKLKNTDRFHVKQEITQFSNARIETSGNTNNTNYYNYTCTYLYFSDIDIQTKIVSQRLYRVNHPSVELDVVWKRDIFRTYERIRSFSRDTHFDENTKLLYLQRSLWKIAIIRDDYKRLSENDGV